MVILEGVLRVRKLLRILKAQALVWLRCGGVWRRARLTATAALHWDGKRSAPDAETHKRTRPLEELERRLVLLVPYAASSIDLKTQISSLAPRS